MRADKFVEVEFLEGRDEASLERHPGWLGVGHTDDGRPIFGQVMHADIGVPTFTQRCYLIDEYLPLDEMLASGLVLDLGQAGRRIEVPADQLRTALQALPRPLGDLRVGDKVTLTSTTTGRASDVDGAVTQISGNGYLEIDGQWWFGPDGRQHDDSSIQWTAGSATPMIGGYEPVRSDADVAVDAEVNKLVEVEFLEVQSSGSLTRRRGYVGLGRTRDGRAIVGEVDDADGSARFTDRWRVLGTRGDLDEMIIGGLVLDDGQEARALRSRQIRCRRSSTSLFTTRAWSLAGEKQPPAPVKLRAYVACL